MKRKFQIFRKASPRTVQKRITLAETRRQAKLEARQTLLRELHPSRPIPGGLIWVAIISKTMREHSLASDLEARTGAFCVIPMVDIKPRRKENLRRPAPIALPLLPRLIFAGYETPPNWVVIEGLPNYTGRLEILKGVPAYIPPMEVVRLRNETESARKQAVIRQTAKIGDWIRIKGIGTEDEIVGLTGKYAILKSMMLGQNIRVELAKVELMEAA